MREASTETLSPGTWVAQLRQLQSGVTQLITTIVNAQIDPEPRLELLAQTLGGRFSLAMQQALVATDRTGETGSLELFAELGVEGAAIDRLASALGDSEPAIAALRTENAQRSRTVRTGGTDLGGPGAYARVRRPDHEADGRHRPPAGRRPPTTPAPAPWSTPASRWPPCWPRFSLAFLVSRLLLTPDPQGARGRATVAHEQLPEAVARIRAGEDPGAIKPIDVDHGGGDRPAGPGRRRPAPAGGAARVGRGRPACPGRRDVRDPVAPQHHPDQPAARPDRGPREGRGGPSPAREPLPARPPRVPDAAYGGQPADPRRRARHPRHGRPGRPDGRRLPAGGDRRCAGLPARARRRDQQRRGSAMPRPPMSCTCSPSWSTTRCPTRRRRRPVMLGSTTGRRRRARSRSRTQGLGIPDDGARRDQRDPALRRRRHPRHRPPDGPVRGEPPRAAARHQRRRCGATTQGGTTATVFLPLSILPSIAMPAVARPRPRAAGPRWPCRTSTPRAARGDPSRRPDPRARGAGQHRGPRQRSARAAATSARHVLPAAGDAGAAEQAHSGTDRGPSRGGHSAPAPRHRRPAAESRRQPWHPSEPGSARPPAHAPAVLPRRRPSLPRWRRASHRRGPVQVRSRTRSDRRRTPTVIPTAVRSRSLPTAAHLTRTGRRRAHPGRARRRDGDRGLRARTSTRRSSRPCGPPGSARAAASSPGVTPRSKRAGTGPTRSPSRRASPRSPPRASPFAAPARCLVPGGVTRPATVGSPRPRGHPQAARGTRARACLAAAPPHHNSPDPQHTEAGPA